MNEPATKLTIITFQNYEIQTVKRDGADWFVNSGICQALDIVDSREALDYLTPDEMNVIEEQEINDHNEFLLSIVSESGMKKLVQHFGNPDAKDFILSRIRLSDIHTDHPGVTEDILSKVRSLHLKATATSKLQAVMDTMQELRAYPKEYAKAIQHIDRTHEFYFDYPAKTSIGGF